MVGVDDGVNCWLRRCYALPVFIWLSGFAGTGVACVCTVVRRRAWVDLLGGLFFLTPFCLLIIISSFPFITNSFVMAEGSPDPGGLPWRFLLKSAIPLGFALLLLQGIAHMLRSIVYLMEKED
jgi:TRAP-type mannitol/chloroaromatic compound transport system permease small subunit